MIPISSVDLPDDVEALVLEVIRSGQLAQGPKVAELERLFAGVVGVSNVVAVNNGTTALVAALQALEVGPGDEVITSPFTFAATLNAILETGASARFANISTMDFNIDSDACEASITSETRALLPVHLYGQCADMPRIERIADRHSLAIVEDAAQAHGASIAGRQAGAWGLGCFSLYATKNITTGEGGLVSTDDNDLADRLRILRNQGMRNRYEYVVPGHNYRMTDLQAAIGIPQVRRLHEINARRARNAAMLSEALADCDVIQLPRVVPGREHVWHQYTILLDTKLGPTRDELVGRLADRGVGTGVYYPRVVFDYECYRSNARVHGDLGDVPTAAMVAKSAVSLPVHPGLHDADIERIANVVIDATRR